MTTTVAEQVGTAAGAVRAANHAAMSAALTAPDTSAVVGALTDLAHRLPQLLEHVARPLRIADPVDYRGSDPIHALRQARAGLNDARDVLEAFARHLDRAHNHLGHLSQPDPEDSTVNTTKYLWRVEEVAELLGICRSRVFGLMNAGELASVKIGSSRRVPDQAVRDYVARLSEGAA
ncbi:MAG: helix-turn-helix protein [Pseudonocardia sp.]|nr:helix-turn-helix protein [Pseudonocardia sp.]